MLVGVSHELSLSPSIHLPMVETRRPPALPEVPMLAHPGRHRRQQLRHLGAWKDQIQQRLCDELGQISKYWAAEPLTTYGEILDLIRNTVTSTGSKVRAYLNRKDYPLKQQPSPARLKELQSPGPQSSPSGTARSRVQM